MSTPSKNKKTISQLPPDLIARIFCFLPISSFPCIASVSRRFKIIVNSDNVYETKLKMLGLDDGEEGNDVMEGLSERMKRLPGGHLLPAGRRYLETGSLWEKGQGGESEGNSPAMPSPGPQSNTLQPNFLEEESEKIIEKKPIIIGAGGLRALLLKVEDLPKVKVGSVRRKIKTLYGSGTKRDIFKKIIVDLKLYYFDFNKKQNDSKLFKEVAGLPEAAAILHQLIILHKCNFWDNAQQIGFNLSTALEWYEAVLLGKFEQAYDAHSNNDMRETSLALYNLGVGSTAVQLFVAKNPIFFDSTLNPTLVQSKLPTSAGGQTMNYSLADEFAEFMDQKIQSCRDTIDIVSQVFVPEVDAMTVFVNKVFDESIGDYLACVLKVSKERASIFIYLHTLASTVYCCTQFLDYLKTNGRVEVNTADIKKAVISILKPYTEKYILAELEMLNKKLVAEVLAWDKGKTKPTVVKVDYLQNQEKAMAHKRAVMQRFKKVIFAPIALTTSLASNTKRLFTNHQKKAVLEAQPVTGPINPAEETGTQLGAETNFESLTNLDDNTMSSLMSLELCMRLLTTNKESLGRALVITYAVDNHRTRSNVEKVFIQLLRVIGEYHLKPAFKTALDRLDKSQPIEYTDDTQSMINQDALQFFELVHLADLIQQMIDVYYSEDIKPWIDEADFLSEIAVEKKAFERLLDEQVAIGMDKAAQTTINQVEYILMKEHVAADYNPGVGGDKVYDLKCTRGCKMALVCLKTNVQLLTGATDKSTLEVFLGEIGARLFTTLIKHMKHIIISPTGAMRLICDLNCYYEYAGSLRVNSVSKMFTVLKEIGHLFIVDGNHELKELVHDQHRYQGIPPQKKYGECVGVLRQDEVLELLASRSDFKKIQKYIESKECIIM